MNTSNVSVTTTPAQGNIEHARRLYSLHLWKSVSSILSNTHKSLVHMKQDIFSLVVQVKYAHFGGSFIFVANFFSSTIDAIIWTRVWCWPNHNIPDTIHSEWMCERARLCTHARYGMNCLTIYFVCDITH